MDTPEIKKITNITNIGDVVDLEPADLSELGSPVEEQEQEQQEQRQSDPLPMKTPENNDVQPTETIVSLDDPDMDKLNIFYSLKNKYENDKHERCNTKILSGNPTGWKRLRKQFKACKPNCINCKRSVGSIFSIKFHNENDVKFRKYIGKCGDTETPCAFNIELNVPLTYRIDEEYKTSSSELNKIQEQIIIAKNKAMFEIIPPQEAVEQFDKMQIENENITSTRERSLNQLINIVQNPIKQADINHKIIEFNERVAEFKILILKHIEDGEPIKPAMEHYVNTLHNTENLSELKYAHREVIKTNTTMICDSSYFLLSTLELTDNMTVVNFSIGTSITNSPEPIIGKKSTKNKTTKNNKPPAKNTTLRKGSSAIDMNEMNNMLDEAFQSLILVDAKITNRAVCDMVESKNKIKGIRQQCGSIITNYLTIQNALWPEARQAIVDVAYSMAMNGSLLNSTINQFIEELNKERLNKSPIDFKQKYKVIINQTRQRYAETLTEYWTEGDPIPKPKWPPAPPNKSVKHVPGYVPPTSVDFGSLSSEPDLPPPGLSPSISPGPPPSEPPPSKEPYKIVDVISDGRCFSGSVYYLTQRIRKPVDNILNKWIRDSIITPIVSLSKFNKNIVDWVYQFTLIPDTLISSQPPDKLVKYRDSVFMDRYIEDIKPTFDANEDNVPQAYQEILNAKGEYDKCYSNYIKYINRLDNLIKRNGRLQYEWTEPQYGPGQILSDHFKRTIYIIAQYTEANKRDGFTSHVLTKFIPANQHEDENPIFIRYQSGGHYVALEDVNKNTIFFPPDEY